MAIHIYNTLTKKKEEFIPLKPHRVNIYTCGVTVYDACHIGHARSLFVFDVIRRYIEFRGYKVRFVRNITDIDDKIIKKAQEELKDLNPKIALASNINYSALSGRYLYENKLQVKDTKEKFGLKKAAKIVAAKYTNHYYNDLKTLEIDKADIEPKATGHITDMIKLIKGLIDKGFAYESLGSVYFAVRKFSSYGKLSGQSIDMMLESAKVNLEPDKKDPLDFALWKKSKAGEPSWKSPWGEGRPGWHIECSVMSMKYLGQSLDIHAGGRDLVFPHHENEIAQSESYTGKPFARYWMHHGLLTINGQKMAKSLGNFVTVQNVMNRYSADILKLFFLEAHYSSPLDFTWDKLKAAKAAYQRFVILFQRLERELGKKKTVKFNWDKSSNELCEFRNQFIKAMDDDFNMPKGLAVLFDLMNYSNRILDSGGENKNLLTQAANLLKELTALFGLSFKEEVSDSDKEIEKLIKKRNEFRQNKDFKGADKIRQELKAQGIIIEDTKDGTIWRKEI